jgi:LysM repeat protein
MSRIPKVPKDHELKQGDRMYHASGGDVSRQYRLAASQSVVVVLKNVGAFVNVSIKDSDGETVTDDLNQNSRLNAQLTKFGKDPIYWLITVTVTNRQMDLGPPTIVWVEVWALPVDSPPPPPEPRPKPKPDPPPPSPAPGPRIYTVVTGDYLSKIAGKFYGDPNQWRKIYNANRATIGSNPDRIYPGQKLTIP